MNGASVKFFLYTTQDFSTQTENNLRNIDQF